MRNHLSSVREIPMEELENPFRLTLEKAQKAIEGRYFHYARSLLFSILDHYPNCPSVRQLARQMTVALRAETKSSAGEIITRTILAWVYYGLRHSPLKCINALEHILAKRPESVFTHRVFVKVALAKELWGTAALSLETITTLEPQANHDQILLSKAYLKLDRVSEAQGIIKTILDRSPQNDFAAELLKQASVAQTLDKKEWKNKI